MFDFDRVISREGTDDIKWEIAGGAIPMWVADMEFPAPEAVQRAVLKRAEHTIYGYTRVPEEWYRAYIGWWQSRHQLTMEREWLMFATGVVPAITAILRGITHIGDQVLVTTPVYHMFYESIITAGCQILRSPLIYENGAFDIDWVSLEAGLKNPKTTAMILCNPHNPTGHIWTREELIRLGSLCRENHVTVISDEIHCDLTAPGKEYVPFASVSRELREICVTCMAPSKAFNIAGLQTAAVSAAEPGLRETVRRALAAENLMLPNVFSCPAAVAALTEGGEWLDGLREYLWENRRIAAEILENDLPGVKCVRADATYLIWLDCTGLTRETEALSRYLKEKAGVMVNAGDEYGEEGKGFLRVNISCPRSMMEQGLKRLIQGIRDFVSQ